MAKEDYAGVVGGGLKFKGDGVKKKKKKSSSKAKDGEKAEGIAKAVTKADREDSKEGEERDYEDEKSEELTAEQLRELRESRMTESERAFARAKRERVSPGGSKRLCSEHSSIFEADMLIDDER